MHRNICRYLGSLFCLSLAIPFSASAQIIINEIMYDPSGSDSSREWIEIYNSGASSTDISLWKFVESASASNHSLTLIQGTASLQAGGFAVIVIDSSKFLTDWPSFTGNILKASFSSLNNTGATVSIKDGGGNVIDQTTYSSTYGGSGDGNSLQRQNDGSWLAALSNPGTGTSSIGASSNSTTTDSGSNSATTTFSNSYATPISPVVTSAHYSSIPISNKKIEASINLSAGRDRVGSVGSPMEFKADANFTYTRNGYFRWSFGDGTQQEGDVLSHTYEYPGDYVVVLNANFPEGKGVSRTNVRIIDSQLVILAADPEKIEIKNNSAQEISAYGRGIFSGNQTYLFPQDTLIKAGQSVILSSKTTGVHPFSKNEAHLITVGQTEIPKIKTMIEEVKKEEIAKIEIQLAQLQSQLVYAYSAAQPKVDTSASASVEEVEIDKKVSATTSLIAASSSGWWGTVKKFFLGRNKLKNNK
jgi:hypothetical protein